MLRGSLGARTLTSPLSLSTIADTPSPSEILVPDVISPVNVSDMPFRALPCRFARLTSIVIEPFVLVDESYADSPRACP